MRKAELEVKERNDCYEVFYSVSNAPTRKSVMGRKTRRTAEYETFSKATEKRSFKVLKADLKEKNMQFSDLKPKIINGLIFVIGWDFDLTLANDNYFKKFQNSLFMPELSSMKCEKKTKAVLMEMENYGFYKNIVVSNGYENDIGTHLSSWGVSECFEKIFGRSFIFDGCLGDKSAGFRKYYDDCVVSNAAIKNNGTLDIAKLLNGSPIDLIGCVLIDDKDEANFIARLENAGIEYIAVNPDKNDATHLYSFNKQYLNGVVFFPSVADSNDTESEGDEDRLFEASDGYDTEMQLLVM